MMPPTAAASAVGIGLFGSGEGLDEVGLTGHANQECEICDGSRRSFRRLTAAGRARLGHPLIVLLGVASACDTR